MGVNEGAAIQLAAGPQFGRRQPGQNVWGIVVKGGSLAEGMRQKTTIIVFCPTQVGVDHDRASSTDSSIDTVFCNCIVMLALDPTVFYNLTL